MAARGILSNEFEDELSSDDEGNWTLDDTGIDIFPSADAIQMVINGVVAAAIPRGAMVPAGNNPAQIVAVYINSANGVWLGIRSKTFAW